MAIDAIQNCSSKTLVTIGGLAGLAFIISGFVAAAGLISNPTMGYLTVGLGAGSGVLALGGSLCKPEFRQNAHVKSIIVSQVIGIGLVTTLGALGIVGMISAVQLGWIFTGLFIALVAMGCILGCCIVIASGGQPSVSRLNF